MKINVQGLKKRYGRTIATDIGALVINQGESIGLVGNNGAGKTTFLRLVLDLVKPEEGRVLLDSVENQASSSWKPRVSSFLDENFLVSFLTAREYFIYVGTAYDVAGDEMESRLENYLPFLSEEAKNGRTYIRELSLGNKKKVGIVAALLMQPELLILDEPFANLDPSSRAFLKETLLTLQKDQNVTTIISSHDLSDIYETSTRILIMHEGQIERDVETKDIDLEQLSAHFVQVG